MSESILEVKGLKKYYPITKGLFRRTVGYVKAVDDVSFDVKAGETIGLVGESGSGKSTIGRCLTRIIKPTSGELLFNVDGRSIDLASLSIRELKGHRANIQMLFQDPNSSLNPRMRIRDIVEEPLIAQNRYRKGEREDKIEALLFKVGLKTEYMNSYPHQLSGGQKQRVGIARALILQPKLIICDEAVSALDVSIQAQVLNLLVDLQKEFNLTYIFIAHDLSVVEYISNRIVVVYLGQICEISYSDIIYKYPKHPYTEGLINSIAKPGVTRKEEDRILIKGDLPNPSNPPKGCVFSTRCRFAAEICHTQRPVLRSLSVESRTVLSACHRVLEVNLFGY